MYDKTKINARAPIMTKEKKRKLYAKVDARVILVAIGDNLGDPHGLVNGLEHVILEILCIFHPAANPHKIIENTDCLSLIARDTSVGHAAGQLDERLDTAERLGKSEDLRELAETLGSGVATLDAEREHAATHAVPVLLAGDVPVWVRVEAGVVDGDNVGRSLQSGCYGSGIVSGLASTKVQGLEATVGEPGVESRRDCANGVLEEGETLVNLVGVERRDTHNDIGVAVDILGHTVNNDVGA